MKVVKFSDYSSTGVTRALQRITALRGTMLRGGLFTREYLLEGIKDSDAWKALDEFRRCRDPCRSREAPRGASRNSGNRTKPETESELIWPGACGAIGWHDSAAAAKSVRSAGAKKFRTAFCSVTARPRTRQLRRKVRADFATAFASWRRSAGTALLDRKDKADPGRSRNPVKPDARAISRRVDDVTRGKLRWGILTNGRQWRLYFQGANSVSEEYLEIDLSGVFHLAWISARVCWMTRALRPTTSSACSCCCSGATPFSPRITAKRCMRWCAIRASIGKRTSPPILSRIVFEDLYPKLVTSIAKHDSKRDARLLAEYLSEVRQGALILLSRLLFVLYAEDRHLLPVERDAYPGIRAQQVAR